MAKFTERFVKRTAEILKDEKVRDLVGEENFPKFETIIKAIIGLDDQELLAKVITIILGGISLNALEDIQFMVKHPVTKQICMLNSLETEE